MPIKIVLYTGPHCELCTVARDLIYSSLEYGSYKLSEVDVTQSLDTKKAYGLRIPVLKNADTEQELGWPFDAAELQRWFGQ